METDVRQLCRSVNRRIAALSGERVMVLCECALPSCFVNVELSAREFGSACSRHGTYVVATGHVDGAALVTHGAGYDLVRIAEVSREDDMPGELLGRLPRHASRPVA